MLLDDYRMTVRIAIGLWVLAGSIFIALAVPAFADLVQVIDDATYELVVRGEVDVLVWLGQALDVVGGPWVVTPVIFVVTAYLAWRERWEAFTVWVSAMLVSQVLVSSAKLMYARPRPLIPLVDTGTYSFPSGHAAAGAAVALALVIVFSPAGPSRRTPAVYAGLFAVVMALSRVYLRAHWLSDVVAGVSIGAAAALSAAVIAQSTWNRREPPGS